MLPEIGGLPEWLLIGLLAGGLASVAVAALFVVANRRFPSPAAATAGGRDGKQRRRDEVRAYLRAIDEPFQEDQTVGEETVAFYLSERDVALTFDARAHFRLTGSGTETILLEYELPATALGARLPFEVPAVDVGRGETGDGASIEDLPTAVEALAELGLSPPASESAVESAYRERVKEVHPDLGGDEREFRRVREAYTTAKRYAAD